MAIVGTLFTLLLAFDVSVFSIFGVATVQSLSSQELLIIPLFILMGGFSIIAGMSSEIYRLAHAWVGHLRGGLALTTVGSSAAFGAICGSSVATTATMVQIALPEMRRRGYSDSLIAGSIAGGGTLGSLIPPSVVMVVVTEGDQVAIRFTPKWGCRGKSRPEGRMTSIHGAPARLRA